MYELVQISQFALRTPIENNRFTYTYKIIKFSGFDRFDQLMTCFGVCT